MKKTSRRQTRKQISKQEKKQLGLQFPLFALLKPIAMVYTARVR